ncbi:hypothetical protein DA89_1522 [Vibrio paracholerae]|nr:hypothetical protein DA89_1522 [Vibrio paracholerae]
MYALSILKAGVSEPQKSATTVDFPYKSETLQQADDCLT